MTDNLEGILWKYDTPHAGALCDLLLQRHGLKQADVARITGLDRSRISRHLANEPVRFDVDASDAIVDTIAEYGEPGLSPAQGRDLTNMIAHSNTRAVRRLEYELSTIKPEYLHAGDRSDALNALVEQLRHEPNPAFIMDDLWFVHAYNGASLKLFGVDYAGRDRDKLRAWQAWHVIATKFTPGSIIRDAHVNPNLYFRPAVDQFFKDIHIFLFTAQVRVLLDRIHRLSTQHKYGFGRMWLDAVTFRGEEFPLESFRRTLRHPSDPNILLEARSLNGFRREIAVVPGIRHTTNYTMVIWNGLNDEAKRFFDQIGDRNQDILFATDFDTDEDNRFHINDWPEVREHIAMIEEAF